jgi:chromosomal replication initiation ATPase DnaA
MATSAQALEDFAVAYRGMLAAARRLRFAIRAEAAARAVSSAPRIDTQDIVVIQGVVAAYFRLTVAELVSRRRPDCIVQPRLMAIELCATLTKHRQSVIGDAFCRDHTMVIHACRHVQDRRLTYPAYARDYDAVRAAAVKSLSALNSPPALRVVAS